MLYNNIISALDINIGDKLSFPSIQSMENLYFSLKAKELDK